MNINNQKQKTLEKCYILAATIYRTKEKHHRGWVTLFFMGFLEGMW